MGEIADIQIPIMNWAGRNGWLARRLQYINRNGAPDCMFLKGGVVVFMEFKRPGRELDPHQERERKRFADHGVYIYRVDNLEAAISIFKDG